MSTQLINEALTLKLKSSSIKFILIILANHANKDGECWISHQTLADECQLSRRFIINAIKELTKIGLISKKNRKHSNNRCRSNLYKILPNVIHKVINSGELTSPSSVNSLHYGIVNSLHPSKEKQKIKKQKIETKACGYVDNLKK